MSMQGYQQAYLQAQNVTEDPRQTEYRLIAQITRAMIEADKQDHGEVVRAVHWNRRLWLTLQSDCAAEENGLPDAVRAGVISLAIWLHCFGVDLRDERYFNVFFVFVLNFVSSS